MLLATVHVDLAEHVEGDVELLCGKLLDLGLAVGLLTPELVARETKNT